MRSAPPTVSPMSRMLVAILGVLSALALVFVQFLPWGGLSSEGGEAFGFTFPGTQVDAYTWKMVVEVGDRDEKESWYSNDLESDEDEGDDNSTDLLLIRMAIPALLAGLIAAAVGALLGFLARGPSALVLLVGGILAALGTVLFAIGVDGFFDSDQDWGASFYLAITASALALIGGIVGLLGRSKGAAS